MNEVVVELVFMMVVLKLPVVYLCLVVWWAVRAEPRPLEGARRVAEPAVPPCPWRRPRPRRPGTPGAAAARRARLRA